MPFLADSAVEIMAMHITARAEPLRAARAVGAADVRAAGVRACSRRIRATRPPIAEVVQQLQYMRAQPDIAGAVVPGTRAERAVDADATTPRPHDRAARASPITPPSTMQQSGVAPADRTKSKAGLVDRDRRAVVVLAAGGAVAFVMMGKKATKQPDTVAQARSGAGRGGGSGAGRRRRP